MGQLLYLSFWFNHLNQIEIKDGVVDPGDKDSGNDGVWFDKDFRATKMLQHLSQGYPK